MFDSVNVVFQSSMSQRIGASVESQSRLVASQSIGALVGIAFVAFETQYAIPIVCVWGISALTAFSTTIVAAVIAIPRSTKTGVAIGT